MTPGEAVGQFVWIDAGNLPLTFTVSKYIEAAGHTLKWLGADPRAEVHEHACADTINRHIETPISQSDTWAKIISGQTETLD